MRVRVSGDGMQAGEVRPLHDATVTVAVSSRPGGSPTLHTHAQSDLPTETDVAVVLEHPGLAPLLVPAAFWFRSRLAEVGLREAVADPAVVGVLAGLGLLGWILITADLSPRFFWPAFPFAATLAARWCSEGRAHEWLSSRRLPSSLVGPQRSTTRM